MRRNGPTVAIVAAFIGFWALVFWAADAFAPWELVTVLGLVVVVSVFGWAVCRVAGLADERVERDLYVPEDWDWPAEDTSTVRNPGLGR